MAHNKRRDFLKAIAVASLAVPSVGMAVAETAKPYRADSGPGNLKLSLNAYSFNAPLSKGEMSLINLLEFCAGQKLPAVDITAYYFPDYPNVPPDAYLYEIKRKAFSLGLHISGTGVRNDFTDPDKKKREADIQMVKAWIVAASKLGAPVIRIFSGVQNPPGFTWDEIAAWMVEDIRECVVFGKAHGVVVAVQNHNDFIRTADQVEFLVNTVNSDWFGLILDTGSYAEEDPYEGIAKNIRHAVSWQIKENINDHGSERPIDIKRLFGLIRKSGYHGYLPIETLGPGDPYQKVPAFLEEVRKAMRS